MQTKTEFFSKLLKSNLFNLAHEITRENRNSSYRTDFAAALRIAYNSQYLMLLSAHQSMWAIVDGRGNIIEKGQWNKRERNNALSKIRIHNRSLIIKPTRNPAGSGRYVELADRTAGLNTGRAWIADGYTVDKHGLHPSWEGELVCYVYPQ